MGAHQKLAILKNLPRGTTARVRNRLQGYLPIPPPRLIYLVAGSYNAAKFCASGASANQRIREILSKNGVDFRKFEAILEFGCGVGRIIRHWELDARTSLFGTDYNPELIRWCQRNLPIASFQVNGLDGRLEYDNEQFNFVYTWSVFSRVLRPGGYLYLTTHGNYYLSQLPEDEQEHYRKGRLVVLTGGLEGSNFCNAYHPAEYVRERFTKTLTIVDHVPEGAAGNSFQDVYLLQKRDPNNTSQQSSH